MGDRVRITNRAQYLVHVAGLGIAPGRTGTLPAAHYWSWYNSRASNERLADNAFELDFDVPWGDDSVTGHVMPTPAEPVPGDAPESPPADFEGPVASVAEPTRHEQIVAAIRAFPAGDSAHWTKAGKPRVQRVEMALDFDVSAAEVAAGWTDIQGGG